MTDNLVETAHGITDEGNEEILIVNHPRLDTHLVAELVNRLDNEGFSIRKHSGGYIISSKDKSPIDLGFMRNWMFNHGFSFLTLVPF